MSLQKYRLRQVQCSVKRLRSMSDMISTAMNACDVKQIDPDEMMNFLAGVQQALYWEADDMDRNLSKLTWLGEEIKPDEEEHYQSSMTYLP